MKKRMTVSDWYYGLRVPGFSSYNFIPFTVSCIGIIRTILSQKQGLDVKVRFTKGIDTAAVDFDSNTIWICDNYQTGVFGKVKRDSSFTIAAICGIVVHEAAHLAYSRRNLIPYAEYIKSNSHYPYIESLAMAVGNMVEDVYIEAEIDRTFPNLFWMLGYSREAVFEKGLKEESFDKAKGITEAVEKMEDLATVFNVLIQHRDQSSLGCNSYIDNLFQKMLTAEDCHTYAERDALALEIYDEIVRKVAIDPLARPSVVSLIVGDELKEGKEATGSGIEIEAQSAKSVGQGHNINSKINAQLIDNESVVTTLERDDFSGEESGTITFIETPAASVSRTKVEVDEKYSELAKVGRQRATVNRPYGLDQKRGNHIRKLHRIATDQRIFADLEEARNYRPMQVLILCDCSGSMKNMGRLRPALSATMGAAFALSQSKCEVAVYGHNADFPQPYTCSLYRFKSFQEPSGVLPDRMSWAVTELSCSENRDGYAIRYLSRKLTDKRRQRLIIVISDGLPNATQGHYKGDAAMRHTAKAVAEVRKQGIRVLSISIADEAKVANDLIYGKENNLCNTDPNCIAEIVQKLVMR